MYSDCNSVIPMPLYLF